jgi:hypothetical protein
MDVRVRLGAVAAALACLLRAGPAAAVPILDQEHVTGDAYGVGSVVPMAQTFTVGLGGILDSIAGQFWFPTGDPGAITVQIRSTVGGVPSDIVLASDSGPIPVGVANIAVFSSFDFLPANLAVSVGEVLAIVAVPAGRQINWNSSNPGNSTYAGGTAWTQPTGWTDVGVDFHFRTFVVPEPSPASLLLLGVGAVVLTPRRIRGIVRDAAFELRKGGEE